MKQRLIVGWINSCGMLNCLGVFYAKSKSNAFFYSTGIITATETFIMPGNESVH